MDNPDDSTDEQNDQEGRMAQEPSVRTHLLIRQTNELYKAIQQSGLSLSEFEWRFVEDGLSSWKLVDRPDSQLVHTPTGYYCTFKVDHRPSSNVSQSMQGGHAVYYSPEIEQLTGSISGINWRTVRAVFDRWLKALKAELEEGDLWAELADQKKLISPLTHQPDNTPFTAQERARIEDALERLKLDVRALPLLTEAQFDAFAERIDYQKRAAGWLGRIDWTNGLVGALMGYVLSSALTPDTAHEVMRLTLNALSWMAHHAPLIP